MAVPASHDGPTAPPPMAAGQPLSEAVADQAAAWLTLLMSGEASDEARRHWQQWRAAHPDHERAWNHIEAVTQHFKVLEPQAGYRTLTPYARSQTPGRRKAVGLLLWAGVAGTGGLLASRTQTWQSQVADHRTGTGEQRTVVLDDGSRVTLNTASAIDLRFDGRVRLLHLVAGEALIATGPVPDARPFVVETAQGRIRALGTRFGVRQRDGHTSVAVLESAVEITPRARALPTLLQAGQHTTFSSDTVAAAASGPDADPPWARGQIVAADMALGDFLAELSRYRPGLLRCDPAVAGLRLSGVFPLRDIDRILVTLPSVLPVRVLLRTRFWVTVQALP